MHMLHPADYRIESGPKFDPKKVARDAEELERREKAMRRSQLSRHAAVKYSTAAYFILANR